MMPDVIGLGCQRCGSSWLHRVLNRHPDIGKPESGLHFFSRQYDEGLNWYASELRSYQHRPILLEFSVSYTYPEFYERAAVRMGLAVPHAKLFIAVRNPIDRVQSDYLRSFRTAETQQTFEQFVEAKPAYLERGLFGKMLTHYLSIFPRDQLLILFYDDLENDPRQYLNTLTDFIGVSPFNGELHRDDRPGGQTVYPRLNRAVYAAKGFADRTAAALALTDPWDNFKARHVHQYSRMLSLNEKQVRLSGETRKRLQDYYAADIQILETISGRSLTHWA